MSKHTLLLRPRTCHFSACGGGRLVSRQRLEGQAQVHKTLGFAGGVRRQRHSKVHWRAALQRLIDCAGGRQAGAFSECGGCLQLASWQLPKRRRLHMPVSMLVPT